MVGGVGVTDVAGAGVDSAGVFIAEPINPNNAPSGLRKLKPKRSEEEIMPSSVERVAMSNTFQMISKPHSTETIPPAMENDFPGIPLTRMPISRRTRPPDAVRMPVPPRPLMVRVRAQTLLLIVAQGITAPTINRSPPVMMSFFGFIVLTLPFLMLLYPASAPRWLDPKYGG